MICHMTVKMTKKRRVINRDLSLTKDLYILRYVFTDEIIHRQSNQGER